MTIVHTLLNGKMCRQLRIEYPGAFYHVTARGNEKQAIFRTDDDRRYFINCLRDACDRFGSIIHVYCLMDNHYHLLIETPRGNLSSVMHLINTSYTVYFNKTHDRFGHLFQGRFKAILVQAESYAHELGPYIHLNPVRANLVDSPEQWPWSNYLAYLRDGDREPWTSTSLVLNTFAADPTEARRRYREHAVRLAAASQGNPLDAAVPYGILGKPEFVERIGQRYLTKKSEEKERDLPQLRRIRPTPQIQEVLELAARTFGPKNRHTRNAAIFVLHKDCDYRILEIGSFFKLSISGTAAACRRFRKEATSNTALSRLVQGMESQLFKRQSSRPEDSQDKELRPAPKSDDK